MITLDEERSFGPDCVVMGIDEAGRGPLAGRVYTAAVSLPLEVAGQLLQHEWATVTDSKKLTAAKREVLAEVIKSTPQCTWAVAFAEPVEIDKLNILYATHLAMRRAALACAEKLRVAPESLRILVDGLPVRTLPFTSRNVVKGDAKSLLIAAASILAKTARDAHCMELDKLYPQYGFAKHKGYPTAAHVAALREFGPCPQHRKSFGPVRQQEFTLE